MNKNTTIGEALKRLEKDIDDFRRVKFALEGLIQPGVSRTGPNGLPASAVNASVHARTGQSVAVAALAILSAANRPLHGLTEIVPALEAQGFHVHPHGLATTLLRSGLIVRVGRGTFALREEAK